MARIEFKATVWAPMAGKGWTFVTLPKAASAKLGAKGRVPVQGTINGFAFRGSAFPDGEGSHQIAVNNDMKKGAGGARREDPRRARGRREAAERLRRPARMSHS